MKKLKKKIFLFSGENLTMPKKTERRNPLGFSNIHSVAKHQKKCRGTLCGKKISKKKSEKKCLAVPKKIERGDSLVSPGMICYAEKLFTIRWAGASRSSQTLSGANTYRDVKYIRVHRQAIFAQSAT